MAKKGPRHPRPSPSGIKTSPPVECHLWRDGNPSMEQLMMALTPIMTYEEESHLIRNVLRCKDCGHLYFHEFTEKIDWREGNDAQYSLWIPVNDLASADKLNELSTAELSAFYGLHYDFPTEDEKPTGPYWK